MWMNGASWVTSSISLAKRNNMTILLTIIFLHVLVIVRAKISEGDNVPYFSTAILSLIMTGFVLYMMIQMEQPVP